MSNNVPEGWLDYKTFDENRRRYPPDELMKYAGQNIAWTRDGTCILASGQDLGEVAEKLAAMGIDLGQAVLDWVPDTDAGEL